jgi:hypothetical protein
MPYVIIIVVCIKAYIGVDLDKPPTREAARNVGPCCPTSLHICITLEGSPPPLTQGHDTKGVLCWRF